jgi:Fuc2NAc and GlcNAc transferase
MGDAGSTFLGYTVGVIGVYLHNTHAMPMLAFVILTALFWFDATFTLWRRFRRREAISQPHRRHAYQRLVRAGFSHSKAVLCAMSVNWLLLALALAAARRPMFALPLCIAAVVVLYTITARIDRIMPFNSDY